MIAPTPDSPMVTPRPSPAPPDPRDALLATFERLTEDARRVLLANAKALEERAARAQGGTVPW